MRYSWPISCYTPLLILLLVIRAARNTSTSALGLAFQKTCEDMKGNEDYKDTLGDWDDDGTEAEVCTLYRASLRLTGETLQYSNKVNIQLFIVTNKKSRS